MIDNYIAYLQHIKGYSENTTKAYEKDVRAFARFMASYKIGARWSTITRADVDKYIITLSSYGLKPATTNRIISSISSIYNYFIREGLTTENPCRYESRRKIGESAANTIPVDEVRQAYDNATGVVKTMIGIIASTGIRIQEFLDMEWEDINWKDATIRIKGKGSRERIVYTSAHILYDLEMVWRMGTYHGKMFYISQRDARTMLYNALRPYCHARQLSPHALRHTFATHMAAEGVNVATLSKALGHKHLETTQRYINQGSLDTKHMCEAHAIIN